VQASDNWFLLWLWAGAIPFCHSRSILGSLLFFKFVSQSGDETKTVERLPDGCHGKADKGLSGLG
jgi:hypothetical protein